MSFQMSSWGCGLLNIVFYHHRENKGFNNKWKGTFVHSSKFLMGQSVWNVCSQVGIWACWGRNSCQSCIYLFYHDDAQCIKYVFLNQLNPLKGCIEHFINSSMVCSAGPLIIWALSNLFSLNPPLKYVIIKN